MHRRRRFVRFCEGANRCQLLSRNLHEVEARPPPRAPRLSSIALETMSSLAPSRWTAVLAVGQMAFASASFVGAPCRTCVEGATAAAAMGPRASVSMKGFTISSPGTMTRDECATPPPVERRPHIFAARRRQSPLSQQRHSPSRPRRIPAARTCLVRTVEHFPTGVERRVCSSHLQASQLPLRRLPLRA